MCSIKKAIVEACLFQLSAVLELFLPRLCVKCQRKLLRHESYLCMSCLASLPLCDFGEHGFNDMLCRFLDFAAKNQQKLPPIGNLHALALYRYDSTSAYSNINKDLKYHAKLKMGRYFSFLLAEQYRKSVAYDENAYIVPIPLHWTRRFLRSYNQAEIIARAISEKLSMPFCSDLIYRAVPTKTQTSLDMEQKADNLRDVFKIRTSVLSSLVRGESLSFVLVDDLFTSGATMFFACKSLLEACQQKSIPINSIKITIICLSFVEM